MENNAIAVKVLPQEITKQVMNQINEYKNNGLKLPKDYSPENALKAAELILSETTNASGKKALEHCTPESIAGALTKMVVYGLSTLKKQGNFIMYGDKLSFDIEYTGNIALAKRYGGLVEINGVAIFEGDEFDFEINPENGNKKIIKHKQTLDSISTKQVKGAYAVCLMANGNTTVEIMSIVQIRDAWNQGAMKGNSPAHKNFPDQMAIKTVINRACKLLIRTSNDLVLMENTDFEETSNSIIDTTHEDVTHEIKTEANTEVLEMEIETEKEFTLNPPPPPIYTPKPVQKEMFKEENPI